VDFETLPNHKAIQQVLSRGIDTGRVAHAQYFQGVDGGGALPLAVAYSQALLAGEVDMFGGVDTRAARLEHPDLHIVFPMVQSVDKTCDALVQEFREAYRNEPYLSYERWKRLRDEKSKKAIISKHEAESVAKKLSLRSFEGGRKILLIWMPELMNQDCANKMLKLIEEPPQGSVILMVGTDASVLLPTIRSRVQLVPLAPLTSVEVQAILSPRGLAAADKLGRACDIAGGSVGAAIDALQEEPDLDGGHLMAWMRLCYQRKVPEVMAWSDARSAEGREEVLRLLKGSLDIFRMAFRKNFIEEQQAPSEELETFTSRFSPYVHMRNAPGILQVTSDAIQDIERNGNARIILLDMSFKMIKLIRMPREEPQASTAT